MSETPQADWERSCISLVLHDKDARAEIFDAVLPIWFGDRADSMTRRAYSWLLQCWQGSYPLDSESVQSEFHAGGRYDGVDNLDLSCEPHDVIRMLRNDWTVRSARTWANKLTVITDRGRFEDIQEEVERFGTFLSQNTVTNNSATYEEALNEMLDYTRERRKLLESGQLLQWGFEPLDYACQIEPARLYVIAARPGVGKTSLGFTAAKHMSTVHQIGYISLEMTTAQMAIRGVLSELREPARVVRNLEHGTEARIVNNKDAWGKKYNLHLNCGKSILIHDLPAICADLAKNRGCKGIWVDHLLDFRYDSKAGHKRHEQIAFGARLCKDIAKNLGIPIFLITQLNRNSAGTQPTLEHLKESGAIEELADYVLLCDRPDNEVATTNTRRNWTIGGVEVDSGGRMAIIPAKSRGDCPRPVVLGFEARTMTPYTLQTDPTTEGEY
jgi:replicative DNA helicase